ncbi:MAG TPA: hypothetical protein VJ600_02570 [Holophagaceae bacterium]|nr:hypothetical protein [Holophagaceae bacterium]
MPRVKVEGLLETLAPELRRALASAVKETNPGITIDEHALYRAFQRAAGRICDTWSDLPSRYVEGGRE